MVKENPSDKLVSINKPEVVYTLDTSSTKLFTLILFSHPNSLTSLIIASLSGIPL